ncbi:hypothetical protein [Streptomyces sp. NPDC054837]
MALEDSSTWDDPAISDDEILYRRVPNVPGFLAPDLISGVRKPTRTAFQFDPDGMSVYRKVLLDEENLGPESVTKKPGQMVFAFIAAVPRRCGVGVVHDPVDDPPAGFAHSSIRGEKPRPDSREKRVEVGDALAEASEQVY